MIPTRLSSSFVAICCKLLASFLFIKVFLFSTSNSFKRSITYPETVTSYSVVNLNKNVDDWQKEVELILTEFLSCGGPTPPNTPCNVFVSKALKRVYNINDFDKPNNQFMTANEIATYVKYTADKWTNLGEASSQLSLISSQGYANAGKAVIAVYESPGLHGHVVLILPGKLQHSGSWNFDCPNCASFFLNKPEKSFVCKHLGYAFQSPENVILYGRNY